MTEIQQAKSGNTSLGHDVVHAVRYYLKGRRGVFVLAGTALVAGLAFNWSWMVAVGIAPLLLSVLPCVAMCALGLCMNKKACSSKKSASDIAPSSDETPKNSLPGNEAGRSPAASGANIASVTPQSGHESTTERNVRDA
ncbi:MULTISPECIES: hypothetical protein [Thalassospira]|jgi:hypothetical protein|uniref:hypothetical protein n=1 Tax=Thalassospira TaxID=168934 RepID=UPI000B18C88A|nr:MULTISPECIES: hypothetical protein [Thalassospira]|tara:strand:- start:1853 stop:2269 length:417 start_codon:yes stop_codon:yes gene_type:complete